MYRLAYFFSYWAIWTELAAIVFPLYFFHNLSSLSQSNHLLNYCSAAIYNKTSKMYGNLIQTSIPQTVITEPLSCHLASTRRGHICPLSNNGYSTRTLVCYSGRVHVHRKKTKFLFSRENSNNRIICRKQSNINLTTTWNCQHLRTKSTLQTPSSRVFPTLL